MAIRVRYITDPACSASWAAEPKLRRLMTDFDAELDWTWVMGGLARDYTGGYEDPGAGIGGPGGAYPGLLKHWLERAESSRMPIDPLLWSEAPIASTYPACMAVKAAVEQGAEAAQRYLRALREGLMCFRRKLDTTEALVEEARRAGLDVARFRIDLGSHAIVEAFGADLEETRTVPDEARGRDGFKADAQGGERVVLPTVVFDGPGSDRQWVFGDAPYEEWRTAAMTAGAVGGGSAPGVLEALERFGTMALPEVEAVCDLPEVRAQAELWALAADWKVKPTRAGTGHLWELA
jgi:putative protein-disulfide isomerase